VDPRGKLTGQRHSEEDLGPHRDGLAVPDPDRELVDAAVNAGKLVMNVAKLSFEGFILLPARCAIVLMREGHAEAMEDGEDRWG